VFEFATGREASETSFDDVLKEVVPPSRRIAELTEQLQGLVLGITLEALYQKQKHACREEARREFLEVCSTEIKSVAELEKEIQRNLKRSWPHEAIQLPHFDVENLLS
jgi:hypothetical protein